MKTHDIFSKRQKRNREDVPDVYQYERIPDELRVQVVQIIDQDICQGVRFYFHIFRNIRDILCREYGRFTLGDRVEETPDEVINFFLETDNTEEAIDVIEISIRTLDGYLRPKSDIARRNLDNAIAELNYRFREHGVGYQYESGKIIRVDSELIHAEVVKPALSLLADPTYKGANKEFLKAHAHYRARRNEECINGCLKAFESCLKVICDKRGWDYKDAAAKNLVDIVLHKGLIPRFMESPFNGFRSALSGVATQRNKLSGHGQGGKIVEVPESMASYALYLTASNILLLARADKEMK